MNWSMKATTYEDAAANGRDVWVPASGGVEEPLTCRGRRLLYCWNPRRGEHGYLDLDQDRILTDGEVRAIFP